MPNDGEFSVYCYDANGRYERIMTLVDARCAKVTAQLEIDRAPNKRTSRVLITDGGDFIAYEWRKGLGVVFPPNSSRTP